MGAEGPKLDSPAAQPWVREPGKYFTEGPTGCDCLLSIAPSRHEAMHFEIKKSLLGKLTVGYDCPNCSSRLSSPLDDAGKTDRCPDCRTEFTVPGAEELQRRRQHRLEGSREKEQERERQQRATQARKLREEESRQEQQRQIELQRVQEIEVLRTVNSVIISTGDLKEPYKIIDTVFALESHGSAGILFGTTGNPHSAFHGVKRQLRETAAQLGGDAVINCQFEYRVAVAGEGYGARQAIEIFAYGTAVKRSDNS